MKECELETEAYLNKGFFFFFNEIANIFPWITGKVSAKSHSVLLKEEISNIKRKIRSLTL